MRFDALYRLLACVIGLGWASTAIAASAAPDITSLPWAQIAAGTALALWGGLTFTAQRVIKVVREGGPDTRLGQAVALDLIVSAGNGFVVYGVGAWQEWSVWQLAVALFAGGYAGTRLLDMASDGLLAAGAQIIARLSPKAEKSDTP